MLPRITLIMGPMFAGKTSMLIKYVDRYRAIGKRCLCVNHIDDNRYDGDVIATHTGDTIPAIKVNAIYQIPWENYDVIAIDEGNFYRDLLELSKFENKIIIVAGLKGTYDGKPFGNLLDLVPIAEHIHLLDALCIDCGDGTIAPFTKRITNTTDTKLVGGKESYKAVCLNHL